MGTKRRFTDEQIEWILTSRISGVKKAKQLNCSRELISQIMSGRVYVDVCPDIPRFARGEGGASSCHKCGHWISAALVGGSGGQCGIGFPEPLEEGPGFARECNTFIPKAKKVEIA